MSPKSSIFSTLITCSAIILLNPQASRKQVALKHQQASHKQAMRPSPTSKSSYYLKLAWLACCGVWWNRGVAENPCIDGYPGVVNGTLLFAESRAHSKMSVHPITSVSALLMLFGPWQINSGHVPYLDMVLSWLPHIQELSCQQLRSSRQFIHFGKIRSTHPSILRRRRIPQPHCKGANLSWPTRSRT
jgi:hypothetical protein